MTGHWALIDGTDTVANVIDWDGVTPYSPPDGLTLVDTNGQACGPQWTYDPATGTFSPPPPDPEP